MMHRRGFTLIELLIVVLIIAVLAAIAVPNFLEFQTRAKASRAKADMRSLSTALEAYYVENGAFPSANSQGSSKWIKALSTPISYISRAELPDPFTEGAAYNYGVTYHYIRYYGCNEYGTINADSNTGEIILSGGSGETGSNGEPGSTRIFSYILFCHGPDRVRSKASNDKTFAAAENIRNPDNFIELIYDPSNGTVSNGEILRGGGSPTGEMPPVFQLIARSQ
ncbi:prepilin-type N-terminal cleavage/methylation domain-containing protein [Candidatus Sumerlaeota bacterium]|nr:prepilin-type N-terminal cleavage/methylation domain-containing protein [Candidatus Sumerlaeota bacterium]